MVGQDVGQLHLEASFGDRALLLEFESGVLASREGPGGGRTLRLRRSGRYSAETDVEVLVAAITAATSTTVTPTNYPQVA